ncbi:TIM barrel protein (plasmid) [Niallia taxi]|uniref:TIM barrel protein n=1 Tax=Niallia taxi TaxID=2499688 RepID=UPI002E2375B9|nr:TIM barrel protein [Niallia taxi]MED4120818.1 TIM barrel protein [Niallia taxi]
MRKLDLSQLAGMNEHFRRHSFEFFLDSMVRLGLKNIELWAASPHLYMEAVTFSEVKKIRTEIEKRQLQLICVTPEQCIYPINIAAKEHSVRNRSVNYFIKSLEVTKELGASMLQIVPGKGYYDEPVEEAWKRARDAIETIVKKAQELDITVVLEALELKESNLIHHSTDLKRMLTEVDSAHLQAVIDTASMAAAGENFEQCFSELGKDLRHIHFVDSGHLAPGDGNLPLIQYLQEISDHDYQGFLTVELVGSRYITDPIKPLENALAYLGVRA